MVERLRASMEQNFKKLFLALGLVGMMILTAILVVGMLGDQRSCVRSDTLREVAGLLKAEDEREASYWQDHGHPALASRIRQRVTARSRATRLDCGLPLPDTR